MHYLVLYIYKQTQFVSLTTCRESRQYDFEISVWRHGTIYPHTSYSEVREQQL